MNKTFLWSPEIMRRMATISILDLRSISYYCLFNILRELEKVTILCDDNVCDILVISVEGDVLAVKAPNFAAFLQLWRSTCWPSAHAPSRPRPSNNSPSSPNAATPSTSPKVLTSPLPPSLPCSQSTKWTSTSACKCPPLGFFWFIFIFVKLTWRSSHPWCIF